jgi:hypothetical protein
MPTNADAQRMTVITTAATPSLFAGPLAGRSGLVGLVGLVGLAEVAAGADAADGDPLWGPAGCALLVSAVVAMVPM